MPDIEFSRCIAKIYVRSLSKLTYSYPDGGRTYELKYIFDELPSVLNAQLVSRSIVIELDKVKEFFDVEFRKRGWFR